MRLIVFIFLTFILIFPKISFASLDYGKQSLLGFDFSGSDLQGATFYLTDLQDANLSDCDLQGASLYGAKLKDTNLEDSFAFSTQFKNVKISGADFTNVFLPNDVLRDFCNIAEGTNPFTNRKTRDSLECD